MMKLPEKFLLSLFFCSFLLLPFYKGFAKSYSLERVQVHAVVQPDGSIDITESRTYNFRGRFSWADYRLPVSGFGGVENFTLADNFGNYIPENNEEPGSYLVEYSDSEFYVRWFYSAENESRTFHLRYSLTDVISVFSDVAELYFKFVGRQNNQSIG
ncbi:MAG: DUF2207 domain-containing protein, partial [Calditrichaeota bacterium]|nr:DUF2207 domain-containing protein [Calditrichota bacterium]